MEQITTIALKIACFSKLLGQAVGQLRQVFEDECGYYEGDRIDFNEDL